MENRRWLKECIICDFWRDDDWDYGCIRNSKCEELERYKQESQTLQKYTYDGLVATFGNQIVGHFKGFTYAASIQKARNNLTYRYKKEHDYLPNTYFILTGEIVADNERSKINGRL